ATGESRYSPRFVGEVRCATTGFGSSWKLSGGRACSSGPTNVAKNRHVRRAINRRARASPDDSGVVLAVSRGRLIHRATAGDAAHSSSKGSGDAGKAGSRPVGRAWLGFEMPRFPGITTVRIGTSVGSAIVARTNAVHTTGDEAGSVHPTTNVRKAAGADSVRRRLSTI